MFTDSGKISQSKLLKAVDRMNELHSTKERVKHFIINGHRLKNGKIIRTYEEYLENVKNIKNSHSQDNIDQLVKMAKSKDLVTEEYKKVSMAYAMCFFYPAEVVNAIDNLKTKKT